jgi:hypothetical protein
MSETYSKPHWWKLLNWWKVAFFVMLLVFEVTREIVVIQNAVPVQPNVKVSLFDATDFTSVSGIWKRTDGGSELLPVLVTIQCRSADKFCTESTVNYDKQYVFPPELTRLDAEFQPDMITYVNDTPLCVQYITRLDLKLKKVSMVRQAKPSVGKMCKGNEERIEATLADGFVPAEYYTKGHFLPILSAFKLAFS